MGVRAVVLAGEGRAFSSGSDITGLTESDSRQILLDEYRPIIRTLRAMPKPVIAAVRGVAAGAGASTALACDLVVMGESARFDLSFIKLGLVPDAGLVWQLVRMIGRIRRAELSWTGGAISAGEALDWGIVNQVVPDGTELETAQTRARDLAGGPAHAIATSKRLLGESATVGLEVILEREADAQQALRQSADHAERLAAWNQRRRQRS